MVGPAKQLFAVADVAVDENFGAVHDDKVAVEVLSIQVSTEYYLVPDFQSDEDDDYHDGECDVHLQTSFQVGTELARDDGDAAAEDAGVFLGGLLPQSRDADKPNGGVGKDGADFGKTLQRNSSPGHSRRRCFLSRHARTSEHCNGP